MNDKPFTKHWVAFVYLLVAMMLDGGVTHILSNWTMKPQGTAVPQITLFALVLIALFVPRESWLIIWAVVFGFIFDMYFSGLIGIYTMIFPLITYVVAKSRPYVPRTWPFVLAVFIIAQTARMFLDYAVAMVLNATHIGLLDVITQHLAPGLTLNMVLFAILYYPCSRLLVKLTRD
ncbi:rod shape-determining protein MreD [Lacticaseibacillus zhaodongensis]|uniref:rod shape-determining protein MreD n=1 Tax=Lacticaseibacillus zhaodongensis TaxID=2668065 RepID=UPI0012D35C65|nr:rod shape-determining protein MreD [Lacticaseibacillus zhaodongensis]